MSPRVLVKVMEMLLSNRLQLDVVPRIGALCETLKLPPA